MIHPTADVSAQARVGGGTKIWNWAQVRETARIGRDCIIGKSVYIDVSVVIGDRCKIENNASIFSGAIIESGVFIGPHACLLNDKYPRATTPDGDLKTINDWTPSSVTVREGASIGAGAIILPGITVGRFALVGAGAVVTRDVGLHELVAGNPAVVVGFVCVCGSSLPLETIKVCAECGRTYSQS